MEWSHVNTDHSLETSTTLQWGSGHRFIASLQGDIQTSPTTQITGEFNAVIPSNEVNNVQIKLSHSDHTGSIKTEAAVIVDRQNMGTVSVDYLRRLGTADLDLSITSKYMADFTTKVTSTYGTMPYRNKMDIQWHPQQKIEIDSNLAYDYTIPARGTYNAEVTFRSPFRNVRSLRATAVRELQGSGLREVISIEFAPRQVIVIEQTAEMVKGIYSLWSNFALHYRHLVCIYIYI